MRLYIIRHADPDYINDTITAVGVLEARALAERLIQYRIDRVFSSPLGRALATARFTAEYLGLPVIICSRLKELDLPIHMSDSAPISVWNMPGDRIRKDAAPQTAEQWPLIPEAPGRRVRSAVEQVCTASDRFMLQLGFERHGARYRILRANSEQITVFCHNGLGLTWLAHLLTIPVTQMWTTFWLSPSSVTVVLIEEHDSGWATPRCLAFADTSHLLASGLPVQTAGLTRNFY